MNKILLYLFLDGAVGGSFLALWQPQALQRGLSVTLLSYYVTFEMIFSLMTDIPTGSLADRIGHRKVALSGIGLYVASFVVAVSTKGVLGLIACALLIALAGSLISGALDAWISDVSKVTSFKRRDQLASLGRAFGALSIPLLATTFGWDLHPGLVWIPHLILGAACLVVALSIPKGKGVPAVQETRVTGTLSSTFREFFSSTKRNLELAWQDQGLRIFLAVSFLIGFTDGSSALAFRPRLVEIGMSTAAAFGFLQAGMAIARTSGVSLLPKLLRVKDLDGIFWSLTLSSSFAALFPFAKTPLVACSLWLARNFCLAHCFPALKSSAAAAAAGTDRMATTLSTMSTMSMLGGFIAAFALSGIGVERIGLQSALLIGNLAQFYGAFLVLRKVRAQKESKKLEREGVAVSYCS